jgi:hypothetical protein
VTAYPKKLGNVHIFNNSGMFALLSSTGFKFSNDSFCCSLINGIKQESREVVTISPADLAVTQNNIGLFFTPEDGGNMFL